MAMRGQYDGSAVRINAATRRSQPSSTVCAIPELFESLALLAPGKVDNYVRDDSSAYNLKELCDREGVPYSGDDDDIDATSRKVEEIGRDYIKSVLTEEQDIKFDTEAKSFANLPTSIYSSRQRPDIMVLREPFVI